MYNPAQQLRCKPTVSATHELLRFGVFELNLTTEELRKAGSDLRGVDVECVESCEV